MAKGTQKSKGIRIPRLAVEKLERVQERIAARTGAACSLPSAMTSAIAIAERTMDNHFMQSIADGLNEKTARSAARMVAEITGEAATVEKVDGHWLIGVAGKSYPVVVDPSALAEGLH